MKDGDSRDAAAGIFGLLALVAAVVQMFFLPFVFAPLALVTLVTAIMLSAKYRNLYGVTLAVGSVGFVVGVSVAVIMGNPLY